MTAIEFFGIAAAVLYFTTFCMKTMTSLRAVGIASNVAWLIYGLLGNLLPLIVMEIVLLPVNVYRLMESRRLIARARANFTGEVSIEALLPYMTPRRLEAGEVLFRKGETSHDMFYVVSGVVRLDEIGTSVTGGEMLGEVSLFSPSRERTATAAAETPVELMAMSGDTVVQLYTQDPKFGSYLIRLITARLIDNYSRLKEEVAETMNAETTIPEIRRPDLTECRVHAPRQAPEEPPKKPFLALRRVALTLLVLLVLPLVGWHGTPYLKSVFSRDAVVTTWINTAASPIQGQVIGPLPLPGARVGATGQSLEIRDHHADGSAVTHAEAEVERLAEEHVVLNQYLTELRNRDAELAARAEQHAKIFERNLEIKVTGMLAELATVKAQLALVRAEAERKTKLLESAFGSLSDADKALIAVRVLERRETELEKEIADADQRKHAIAQGVFITREGTSPDWAYDNRDALQLEITRTRKAIATVMTQMTRARTVALAERETFQRNVSSEISLPPGSILWSVPVDEDATVVPGQLVVQWIDCGTLFIDVPVGPLELAALESGMIAKVILDGETAVRQGKVMQVRGAASRLGPNDLAALSTQRGAKEGQVLLTVDLTDIDACPVGRGASVAFPEVDFIDMLRSRLRI